MNEVKVGLKRGRKKGAGGKRFGREKGDNSEMKEGRGKQIGETEVMHMYVVGGMKKSKNERLWL